MTRHRGGGGGPSKPVAKETGSINGDPPTPPAPPPKPAPKLPLKREPKNSNLVVPGNFSDDESDGEGGRRRRRRTRTRKHRKVHRRKTRRHY